MRLRAILVLPLVAAGLLVVGPISAASGYPPTTCPTISVSTTDPLEGQSIGVNGTNFAPNAAIKLVLQSPDYQLGTVHSSAAGTFTTSVRLPAGVTGSHLLVAIGGGSTAGAGCPADPSQGLDILGNGSSHSGSSGGGSGGGGGTAFTGLDVLALLVAAGALLAAGIAFARGGRRRRAHVSRH